MMQCKTGICMSYLMKASVFALILDAFTNTFARFDITLDHPTEVGYINADNINTEL